MAKLLLWAASVLQWCLQVVLMRLCAGFNRLTSVSQLARTPYQLPWPTYCCSQPLSSSGVWWCLVQEEWQALCHQPLKTRTKLQWLQSSRTEMENTAAAWTGYAVANTKFKRKKKSANTKQGSCPLAGAAVGLLAWATKCKHLMSLERNPSRLIPRCSVRKTFSTERVWNEKARRGLLLSQGCLLPNLKCYERNFPCYWWTVMVYLVEWSASFVNNNKLRCASWSKFLVNMPNPIRKHLGYGQSWIQPPEPGRIVYAGSDFLHPVWFCFFFFFQRRPWLYCA